MVALVEQNAIELGGYGGMKMYSALFDNIHPSNCSAVASARADHLFPRLAPQHQQDNQRKSDDSVTHAKVLKENIQRYVNGMGLTQFDPVFYTASDPSSEKGESGTEKNVAWLKKTLINIYGIVKKRRSNSPAKRPCPRCTHARFPASGYQRSSA